jgi:hypothetical protein
MSQKQKVEAMLRGARIRFESETGEVIEDNSRLRYFVESRAALGNAMRPYATLVQIGKLFNKDHSTFVHHRKEHDGLMLHSPDYLRKYSLATRIVMDLAQEMDINPISTKLTSHDRLIEVQKCIKLLTEMEEKLIEGLGYQMPSA